MKQITIEIADSLLDRLCLLAKREGISVDQLVSTVLAEKIAALMTVDYLKERDARGRRKKFEAVLAKVRDIPPEAEDALPSQ